VSILATINLFKKQNNLLNTYPSASVPYGDGSVLGACEEATGDVARDFDDIRYHTIVPHEAPLPLLNPRSEYIGY
jgi:hypothetical protein